MAKRFTDTDKWKKKWFRGLTPGNKLFWQYLLDSCNHGGVWEVDFGLAEFQIGVQLDKEEINTAFCDRVTVLDNGEKWFIHSFPGFQYGELKPNHQVHKSVAKILSKYNLLGTEGQPLPKGCPSNKDQDKNKALAMEKDQDQDKNQGAFDSLGPLLHCPTHDIDHTETGCPLCIADKWKRRS